ncbi:MAG: hypothetical protein DRQ51_07890 [Gammaproteobacteria bacterium]|nr:MAG: hypothetical protein DRQ51_07890 [Gammaproteobacteria bacterium]
MRFYKYLSIFLITIAPFSGVQSADFKIQKTKIYLKKEVYYLSTNFKIPHKKAPIAALKNGAALSALISIDMYKNRVLWRDKHILNLKQEYKIQYYNLANLFQLTNINTNKKTNFSKLRDVFAFIGTLRDLPLIDKILLLDSKNGIKNEYYGFLSVLVSIENMPLSTKSYSFFSSDLQIKSNRLKWLLEQ